MQTSDGSRWKRTGSSIIWSPQLLGPLITGGIPTPLRSVLSWMSEGFPEAVPGNQQYVLVGGLQTVMETLMQESPETAYMWLRQNVLPLIRQFQRHWPSAALIFVMDGPAKMFTHNESDDLVYFGKSAARDKKVKLTLGVWNGAATGEGACRVVIPDTSEVGGYHVQRVS